MLGLFELKEKFTCRALVESLKGGKKFRISE